MDMTFAFNDQACSSVYAESTRGKTLLICPPPPISLQMAKEREEAQKYWAKELQTPGRARPWRRAKVMFVGEGRAGKTCALRSMLSQPYVDTASTVGTEMFDVSVETAVQWTRQDRDIPELHRVAARGAAWRKQHGGKAPPWELDAMVSDGNAAASASATASAKSGL